MTHAEYVEPCRCEPFKDEEGLWRHTGDCMRHDEDDATYKRNQKLTAGVIETEADLATFVHDTLDLYGWRWCHFRPARTDKGWRTALTGHKGWPDIFAVRGSRSLAMELKAEDGRVTSEQMIWLTELDGAGIETAVFRPSDREAILRALSA